MRQEPEGFKEFWEQVWRPHARHTDGRGLAREAFARHIKSGAEPQDIIDGAKWFFRTMKERDREFVPLSATWLNRGAYEDLAIQYRANEARRQERQQPQEKPANVINISPERRSALVAEARARISGARLQEA